MPSILLVVVFVVLLLPRQPQLPLSLSSYSSWKKKIDSGGESFDRRKLLLFSTVGFLSGSLQQLAKDGTAVAVEFADMPALRGKDYGKTKMRYTDYTETKSGLQYKDLRVGIGSTPKMGETVVVDWDGYTIGYYGRIFEARNKTKGGSFEMEVSNRLDNSNGDDKDFFKFTLGSNQLRIESMLKFTRIACVQALDYPSGGPTLPRISESIDHGIDLSPSVIPAFEEAIVGMTPGSVRR
ncbi:hypothetical protein ACLOJK_019589 [Asimina triloba]